MIRPGKQFSFQTTTERGCQLRIGAGRELQVDGPATVYDLYETRMTLSDAVDTCVVLRLVIVWIKWTEFSSFLLVD